MLSTEKLNEHAIELPQLLEQLATDPFTGLSKNEAEKRLEEYGPNEIPEVKGNIWQIYLAPLFNWLINTYLVMTAILLILSIWNIKIRTQAIQWLIFVLVNMVIAIVQQVRATKKIEALRQLAPAMTKVIREGQTIEVETKSLVPGDIVRLGVGDRISADGRILKSSAFIVNEASLTGESLPVTKAEGDLVLDEEISIGERINMVFGGTFVQMGSAQAVIIHTGVYTEIGKIQTELNELNTGDVPLRDKVNQLGRVLAMGVILFLMIQLTWQLFAPPYGWDFETLTQETLVEDLSAIVITSMSIMPINIPLLTTIVLLTGVLALAGHKVLIRDLGAIESLGRVSVLCSDKTGTITKNEMTVKRVWTDQQLYGVTGLGYGPKGTVFFNRR